MEYQLVHGQFRQKKSLVQTIKCPPRTTRTNEFVTPALTLSRLVYIVITHKEYDENTKIIARSFASF